MTELRAKRFRLGTHRATPPEETLARLQPLLTRAGITRVAHVTGLDHVGIPVVMVVRPNAKSLSVSQGKGATPQAAEVSGIMEALEDFHAERPSCEIRVSSYVELCRAGPVADVQQLPRIAELDPDAPIPWVQATRLGDGQPVWVPYELVHCDFRIPYPAGSGVFPISSNGVCAGNTIVEAINHGLYELVERDALRLWQAHPPDDDYLDPATVTDPLCQELLTQLFRAELDVGIWDVTSDVGLPTFKAVIAPHDRYGLRHMPPAGGSGCHCDRGVAMSRALTEAAQSRLTQIAGVRDDILPESYDLGRATPAPAPAPAPESLPSRPPALVLAPAPGLTSTRATPAGPAAALAGPRRSFQDVPTCAGEDLQEDLDTVVQFLAAQGMHDVLTVDLARPELGIAVFRVIVPGLEGPGLLGNVLDGPRAHAARAHLEVTDRGTPSRPDRAGGDI